MNSKEYKECVRLDKEIELYEGIIRKLEASMKKRRQLINKYKRFVKQDTESLKEKFKELEIDESLKFGIERVYDEEGIKN